MWKRIRSLWPLLVPLLVTANLYSQCHGVVQLQYNGQNIGTASTINFVCPGGGGGGGGGSPTLNVTVNGGLTYNIPTNLRINQGTNMTVSSTIDGTTEDVTLNSTGGGGTFSGDVSSTTQGYLNNTASGQGVQIRDVDGLVVANAAGTANATLTCSSSGILALKAGQAFTADTIFPTTANSSLLLEPSGSGAGVIIQSGRNLATDNITSTSNSFLTLQAGTGAAVRVQDTAGFEICNDTATTGATLTCVANGVLTLKAGQTFATDNITSSAGGAVTIRAGGTSNGVVLTASGPNGNILLSPQGTGQTINAVGKALATDSVTSSAGGAVTINSGGANTNITLTPSGTGSVSIPVANPLSATQITFIPAGIKIGLNVYTPAGNTTNVSWTNVSVSDGSNGAMLGAFTGSASCATAGPIINGRDQAGTFANNVWVYIYAISKVDGTVPALLLSQSATSPTFPTNYTKKCLLDAFFTGPGTNNQATNFWQSGRAYYNNPIPILTGGTATTYTSLNTGSSTGIATAIPPQATSLSVSPSLTGTVLGAASLLLFSYDGVGTEAAICTAQVSTLQNLAGVSQLACAGQAGWYKVGSASDTATMSVVSWGWDQ